MTRKRQSQKAVERLDASHVNSKPFQELAALHKEIKQAELTAEQIKRDMIIAGINGDKAEMERLKTELRNIRIRLESKL